MTVTEKWATDNTLNTTVDVQDKLVPGLKVGLISSEGAYGRQPLIILSMGLKQLNPILKLIFKITSFSVSFLTYTQDHNYRSHLCKKKYLKKGYS